jgi:hypothetical protein
VQPVSGREDGDRLADPHPVGKRSLLELDAHPAADLLRVAGRVETEDPHSAGIGVAKSGDALDRGCLARTVRSQDAEDLAVEHGQRHAVHGHRVAVGLAQVVHLNDRRPLRTRALPTGPWGRDIGRRAPGIGHGTSMRDGSTGHIAHLGDVRPRPDTRRSLASSSEYAGNGGYERATGSSDGGRSTTSCGPPYNRRAGGTAASAH